MQIKHTVTTSTNMSSSGGCEMQWMSQDEGSDRRSRSLVCSSVMGVKDARMTSIKRERSGGVKISQELMNALFSKTFQSLLPVAPLLSLSGTLSPLRIPIVSEWHLVSIENPHCL